MKSSNWSEYLLVRPVVGILKLIVTIYTVLTLPIYYLLQKPWRRLEIAASCGAHLSKRGQFENDRHIPPSLREEKFLEYKHLVPVPEHPLMKCSTVAEAMETVKELYPMDRPALGYREVLEEQIQLDHNGKPLRIDGKTLRKYKLSDYRWITYGEIFQICDDICRGLWAIGLKKYDPVAIYSETGVNFLLAQSAINRAKAVMILIFHTLSDQGLIHALNETKCKFIFVSFELLDRLSGFIKHCPTLKTVIYFEGPKKKTIPDLGKNIHIYTFDQLKNMGRREPFCHMQPESLDPNELFGIMYTSGTSGLPKGVKLKQNQLKEACMAISRVVRDVILDGPNHTYIAYLPQAHILELTIEFFLMIGGVKIGFATPFTLNENAPGLAEGQICDLQLLKPTVMCAVPLVLDRMQKEIYDKLRQRTIFSKAIFDYLIEYKAQWLTKGYQTPIVNALICPKVRTQFGNRLEYLVVGSAPLAAQLQKQIKCALNVTLIQGYGCTETSGAVFCMDFNDLSFGRIGAPLNDVHARMINWLDGGYCINDRPNPRGELVIGGKMISEGYFNHDELNRESFFDDDGKHWFVTGDIAEVFPDGTFSIVDRKKDIVKLANGEFISLGKIEAILKSSAHVDNICMVPNSKLNCLVALVMPNQVSFKRLMEKLFPNGLPESEIFKDPQIVKTIHQNIIQIGFEQGLKPIELPSMINLCQEVWSPDNDLLTAAMKLKRKNFLEFYAADLERMWLALDADPRKIKIRIS